MDMKRTCQSRLDFTMNLTGKHVDSKRNMENLSVYSYTYALTYMQPYIYIPLQI